MTSRVRTLSIRYNFHDFIKCLMTFVVTHPVGCHLRSGQDTTSRVIRGVSGVDLNVCLGVRLLQSEYRVAEMRTQISTCWINTRREQSPTVRICSRRFQAVSLVLGISVYLNDQNALGSESGSRNWNNQNVYGGKT